jgi:hypothetical protein
VNAALEAAGNDESNRVAAGAGRDTLRRSEW